MDALAHAIAPLYDNLTMEATVEGAENEKLGNVMFTRLVSLRLNFLMPMAL